MKNKLSLLLIFTLTVMVGAAIVASMKNERMIISINPEVVIEKESVHLDFGLIKNYHVQEKKIIVKNLCAQTISLSEGSASCGCASVVIPEKIPGKSSSEIVVRYNPLFRKGPQKQSVDINIENGSVSTIQCDITANIQPSVIYSPHLLVFRSFSEMKQYKQIQVDLKEHDSFVIESIEIPEGYDLSLKMGDSVEDDSFITVTKENNSESEKNKIIEINGDRGELIVLSIIERASNSFICEPEFINFVVFDPIVRYRSTMYVVPSFPLSDDEELHCSSPLPNVTVSNQVYNDDMPNILPLTTKKIEVVLSCDMISSSTQTWISLKYGDIDQRVPIFITKIN